MVDRRATAFRCSVLLDDSVYVVGEGRLEPSDLDWFVDALSEACDELDDGRFDGLVVDLRDANVSADVDVEAALDAVRTNCQQLGVRVTYIPSGSTDPKSTLTSHR